MNCYFSLDKIAMQLKRVMTWPPKGLTFSLPYRILKEFHCGYHSYLMCLIALALLFFLFIVVTLSQLSLSVWLCKKNDVLLAYL